MAQNNKSNNLVIHMWMRQIFTISFSEIIDIFMKTQKIKLFCLEDFAASNNITMEA